MRCTHCGSIIPPGLIRCPICGTMADSMQAQEDYRYHQQYPKTNGQENSPPAAGDHNAGAQGGDNPPAMYATPAFHTYRQQRFTGNAQTRQAAYEGQMRDNDTSGGRIASALSDLPQVVKGSFINPTSTLEGMICREDRYTGGIIVLISLVFAFLAGMILVKGALGALFAVTSGITGLQWADTAASLNQGVAYLAGKVGVPVGGVAAVCQLIAAVMPVAVTMVYLSVIRQVRFSFLLLSNFTAIVTLPHLFALLFAAVGSLISPYLSLLILLLGQVLRYVLLCTMAVQLANVEPRRAVLVQASLVSLSMLTTIILIAVIGGAMMNSVIRTLTSVTNAMGGLL